MIWIATVMVTYAALLVFVLVRRMKHRIRRPGKTAWGHCSRCGEHVQYKQVQYTGGAKMTNFPCGCEFR
jgi:hypothetical protein